MNKEGFKIIGIILIAICFLILIGLILALPANAQAVCMEHDAFSEMLAKNFGEQRIGFGITADQMIEIYTSKTGTYTMLATRPDHVSCLFAAGDSWQTETPSPLGDKT